MGTSGSAGRASRAPMQRRCVLPLIRLITFRGGVQTTETLVSLCLSMSLSKISIYWPRPRADGNGDIMIYPFYHNLILNLGIHISLSLAVASLHA